MTCKKQCNCLECEMLQITELTYIDDTNPFNQKRWTRKGFHCQQTGNYGETTTQLKHHSITTDTIYTNK